MEFAVAFRPYVSIRLRNRNRGPRPVVVDAVAVAAFHSVYFPLRNMLLYICRDL